jgi:3-oxoacyl-[acyl-carrier protein] reductase
MMEDIIDRWGIPEILINNAGITVDATLPLLDETSWIEVIETHLKGAFHTIRLLGEQMSSRKRGHILNIGSWVGLKGRPGQSAYAAAKAGLVGLTLSAARELGGDGVQVNIVLPGFLQTSMQQGLTEGARAEILGLHLLSVPPSMEETADWIYFLSQRRGVSGQIFNLDSRPAQTF